MGVRHAGALVGSIGLLVAAAVAGADTLVLRSGERVQGELVGVRDGTIEFRERRGLFGGRTARYDRGDVERIELDEVGGGGPAGDDSGPRPRGMREKYVTVAARTQWTDTGIRVRPGQAVYFEASGRVRWGADRRDGPEGESGRHHNPNRPIPGRPGAALIGRVGDSGPFFIGAETGPVRMRSSGPLYLGINDDHLQDNSGSFTVTVYY